MPRTDGPVGLRSRKLRRRRRLAQKDGEFAIDPSGSLPNGASFNGPADLKKILKGRSKDFTRCLAEKMLTYAIGRGLEFKDRCVLDAIGEELSKRDHRFSVLVTAIVKSQPFRYRAVEGEQK